MLLWEISSKNFCFSGQGIVCMSFLLDIICITDRMGEKTKVFYNQFESTRKCKLFNVTPQLLSPLASQVRFSGVSNRPAPRLSISGEFSFLPLPINNPLPLNFTNRSWSEHSEDYITFIKTIYQHEPPSLSTPVLLKTCQHAYPLLLALSFYWKLADMNIPFYSHHPTIRNWPMWTPPFY